MDCVVKFAIGMQNDKFDLRFAPSWTPMQPAQFYVTLRPGASTKLQGWARALNAWNTTEDGGSFAYPHEAMLAFLKEAERSYINLFDSAEEDDSTHTPGGDGHGGSSKAHANDSVGALARPPVNVRQNTADQLRRAWDTYDADTSNQVLPKAHPHRVRRLQEKGFCREANPEGRTTAISRLNLSKATHFWRS